MTWHRSDNKLPESGCVVLAYDRGQFDLVSRHERHLELWWVNNLSATTFTPPKYWRALPEPPR